MRGHIINFQGKVSKGIVVPKCNVLREFVMNLLASTRVFHKKINEFLIFVLFDVLFVDLRHILDNCKSHWLSLEEWTNVIFHFVTNGFYVFGNIFFSNKKTSIT